MAEVARDAPGGAAFGATGAPRVVRRRRGLPGGRALLGGLLVAVATVGTFAAATSGGDGRRPQVVAARELDPGHVVAPGDLTTARFGLPEGTDAFVDPASLVGAVLVSPLAAGDLVSRVDVVAAPAVPGGAEVSVPVPVAQALGGSVQRGERIDLLATLGTGTDACTTRVAAGALVVSIGRPDDGLGARDEVVLRLALPSSADATAVAHAAQAGELTVVRVSGAAGAGGPVSTCGTP